MKYDLLIKQAIDAREKAYAPYSQFKVGAAVLTEDNKLYTGCNIENASYGATNCAERTAIYKAVSEGHCKIKALAVVGNEKEFTYPCGICRQVIQEFATEDFQIIIIKNKDEYIVKTLLEIFPLAFDNSSMK
ncbi:cytidine deaminase [Hathewaya proteolytica DSM 3090]|uniref:Cytidine deaminase n=1 Tax=Hathewaya proteolytica DSM 3090 TaxID=1121331 RepID=A0A1M6JFG5_9CLOT|nr:cytidine deaminase [Hathewaya proteolytica]SHJ45441.1 cytidine deaminase [Hathewaya proteolytica DSM 3090]